MGAQRFAATFKNHHLVGEVGKKNRQEYRYKVRKVRRGGKKGEKQPEKAEADQGRKKTDNKVAYYLKGEKAACELFGLLHLTSPLSPFTCSAIIKRGLFLVSS